MEREHAISERTKSRRCAAKAGAQHVRAPLEDLRVDLSTRLRVTFEGRFRDLRLERSLLAVIGQLARARLLEGVHTEGEDG